MNQRSELGKWSRPYEMKGRRRKRAEKQMDKERRKGVGGREVC